MSLNFVFAVAIALTTAVVGQKPTRSIEGMWSDAPRTTLGQFCIAWCTDGGIEYLNKLLDNPDNDSRSFTELQAEAANYQRETQIRPKLTGNALKTYPLDAATDPSFLRCEPFGLGQQMFALHQLEIRQYGNQRIEIRYGEWAARRIVYMDQRKPPANKAPTLLGYSIGHWEGETLVIQSSGISARRIFGHTGAEHSEQLRIIERYTRSEDGKVLTLTATLEDPWALTEPIVLKKMWGWAPDQKITSYDDCERPTKFKLGTK